MNKILRFVLAVTLFTTSIAIDAQDYSLKSGSIYKNDMEWVLGDVKQAFIHNKITKQSQVDNLIKGFKNLQVNGIRMPIFTPDSIPNKAMLDYFFNQAKAAGFPIFANPVLTSGGQCLANGDFKQKDHGGPVRYKSEKTQKLIDEIKAYAQVYPCKWICPFNEDGAMGKAWSKIQINTIFSSLHNQLNGAELIGPCPWGTKAGVDLLKNTDVMNYISIATSHNLGFEHGQWKNFINEADKKNLPVWDSEVNHNQKYPDKITRMEAAIENKVDGLVFYNSWQFINLTNGNIKNSFKDYPNLYLKPNSLNETVSKNDYAIYPNPALEGEQVWINHYSSIIESFEIYDITGKAIRGAIEKVTGNKITISGLSPGIYMIKVNNHISKLVVN